MSEYLCHYLGLWKSFNGGTIYDERCFVNTLVLAGLIVSGHLVAASTILLLGGFVAGPDSSLELSKRTPEVNEMEIKDWSV